MASGMKDVLRKMRPDKFEDIIAHVSADETLHVGEDHRAYLSRLIRRAIGFDITLRRG